MGLEFCESFSGYKVALISDASNSAIIQARWTTIGNTGNSIISTDTRGNYFTSDAATTLSKTMTHHAGFTCGGRVSTGVLGNSIFQLANNNQALLTLNINNDGTLSLVVANTHTFTTNAAIHINKWYYYEMSMSMSGSSAITIAYELRVNGETLLSGSQLTTLNNANFPSRDTTGNVFTLGPGKSFRDVYVNNTASSFDGDIIILAVRPNGDVVSNWTTSTGTTHYTLVNEIYSDLDASYVYTTVSGSQDIYTWEDIPAFTGIIQSIQISFIARKDEEGSKAFQIVTGTSGTETTSPDFFMADDYISYFQCQDTDPATSTNWTVTGFNAKDFGIKLTT